MSRPLATAVALGVALPIVQFAAAVPAHASGSTPPVVVQTAYVDQVRAGGTTPSPWQGASGVTFVGSASGGYDAGVIKLDNTSSTSITVSDVTVKLGTYSYDLWGSQTIPGYGTLILTQTAYDNFDTSDTPNGSCQQSGWTADIQVTTGGNAYHFADVSQTLNTGGVDSIACPSGATNESIPGWTFAPFTEVRSASEQLGGSNGGEAAAQVCSAGDPVNCSTGNLFETLTDLAVAGRGPAVAFTRNYNALSAASAATAGVLGWGWTDGYAANLALDGGGGATVTLGNGATVPFIPGPNGTFAAPAQVTAMLVHNGDGTYTFTTADGTSMLFTSTGALSAIKNEAGDTLNLSYTAGSLSSVTGASGRSLSLTYDSSGRLSSVTDGAGRHVTYGYDGASNLTSVTDPSGAIWHYGYDNTHRLTTVTNPNGGITTTGYDGANRVTSQRDPLGRLTTWAYNGATTTITDPAGHVRVDTFDASGHLTSSTSGSGTPDAATWTYQLQPGTGNVSIATDPLGNKTTFGWNLKGALTSRTDPLNRTSLFSYDAAGHLLTATDPTGVVTSRTYDAHGQLSSTSTPLTGTGQSAVTSYGYDPAHPGDLTSVTDPLGKVWHYGHDAAGDLTSVTSPLGNTSTRAYDSVGQLSSTTTARGNVAGANPADYTSLSRVKFLGQVLPRISVMAGGWSALPGRPACAGPHRCQGRQRP